MRPAHIFFVQPKLPEQFKLLYNLAMNIYWHKNTKVLDLFRRLDPALWEEAGHNPLSLLYRLQESHFTNAARDEEYMQRLAEAGMEYQTYQDTAPAREEDDSGNNVSIAFFSAEFGLTENLPIYSGGLGLLAGDYLKSASDLGLSLSGVGLMYRKGYFRQIIDGHGWQQEIYPLYDMRDFPMELIRRPDGNPLMIHVDFPDKQVYVQIWRVLVGRVSLYLLDTDNPCNGPEERDITDRLYGGDLEKRIQQEIILGIGGMRALNAIGIEPLVCHLNEGHSAFLALERIRQFMSRYNLDFETARELAASSQVFTTHTPVNAGIDLFSPGLMDKYFSNYYPSLGLGRQEFLALGQLDQNPEGEFNMAVLALRLSTWANGVSKLHGRVARQMWHFCWPRLPVSEIPITSITNGVHITSWIGNKMAALYDRYLGDAWRLNPAEESSWNGIWKIPDKELWQAHQEEKSEMLNFIRRHLVNKMKTRNKNPEDIEAAANMFDPSVLTIGFARRFASYKRPTLILRHAARLFKILNDPERPVQIIFAGKAHPRDDEGKKLIQQVINFIRHKQVSSHVVFLEDYNIDMACHLVRGVDLWLGNPRRPLEASSTSGMKVVINGGLHISTLDGWWDEAWNAEAGWAIGGGEVYDNHQYQDDVEAESLYYLLEKKIIPLFYRRDGEGLPVQWLAMMKKSIQTYGAVYNSHRMVDEYNQKLYMPAAGCFKNLLDDGQKQAKDLIAWKRYVRAEWDKVRIEKVEDDIHGNRLEVGDTIQIRVTVFLGRLKTEDVKVEVLFGAVDEEGRIPHGNKLLLHDCQDLGQGRYLYTGVVPCDQSGRYGYHLKVYPHHDKLIHPYPDGLLLWG